MGEKQVNKVKGKKVLNILEIAFKLIAALCMFIMICGILYYALT